MVTTLEPTVPETCQLPLTEFIPAVSPNLVYPHWLEPVAEVFRRVERAWETDGDPVRVCVAVPTQHGKSTLATHALARFVGRWPHLRHLYLSYAAGLAAKLSLSTQKLATIAGVELDQTARDDWTTVQGGGVLARGVGGGIAGFAADGVIIIDDPIGRSKDSRSPVIRDAAWEFISGDVLSRIGNKTSVILIASRFHVDDPTGRAIKEHGWEYVNIPAIRDDGTALCEERRSLKKLLELKATHANLFYALQMGQPRAEGGSVFETGMTCSMADLPVDGLTSIGVDLAYTAKTSSDFSVAVVARRTRDGDVYILEVLRRQCRPDVFGRQLKALSLRHAGAPLTWHVGHGPETEVARLMQASVPALRPVGATPDKLTRALPAAELWNAHLHGGRTVYTPRDAPWASAFLDEIQSFKGVGDAHDDQVDALASAISGMPTYTPRVRHGAKRRSAGLRRAF